MSRIPIGWFNHVTSKWLFIGCKRFKRQGLCKRANDICCNVLERKILSWFQESNRKDSIGFFIQLNYDQDVDAGNFCFQGEMYRVNTFSEKGK